MHLQQFVVTYLFTQFSLVDFLTNITVENNIIIKTANYNKTGTDNDLSIYTIVKEKPHQGINIDMLVRIQKVYKVIQNFIIMVCMIAFLQTNSYCSSQNF